MKRCVSFAVLLLLCLSAFGGCKSSAPPDYLAFQRESFSAEVQGRIGGRAFGAKIEVEASGEARRVTVTYLSPTVLEGVRITALCNADGVPNGDCEVTYGDMTLVRDATELAGLLSPVSRLLTLSEIATVRRDGDTYILTFSDGAALILDANGNPKSLAAKDMELDIVWRETAK